MSDLGVAQLPISWPPSPLLKSSQIKSLIFAERDSYFSSFLISLEFQDLMRFDICSSFANKCAHNLLEELAFDWPYMSEKIQELQTVLSSNQRFHVQMQILAPKHFCRQ